NSITESVQDRFELSVPGKSIPKQAVDRDGRHQAGKRQPEKRRMVSDNDRLANLGQGLFKVPGQDGHHFRRETCVVNLPVDDASVVMSPPAKDLGPQALFPIVDSMSQLIDGPG